MVSNLYFLQNVSQTMNPCVAQYDPQFICILDERELHTNKHTLSKRITSLQNVDHFQLDCRSYNVFDLIYMYIFRSNLLDLSEVKLSRM